MLASPKIYAIRLDSFPDSNLHNDLSQKMVSVLSDMR